MSCISGVPAGFERRPSTRAASIVRRFLQTHALIGLADLTRGIRFRAVEAAELLERWCEEGKVVRIGEDGPTGESRWAERGNLDRDAPRDRGGAAAREPGGPPEVFADFLLRRQHVHPPPTAKDGAVELVLEQLKGLPRRRRSGKTRSCRGGSRDIVRPGWTKSSRREPGSGGRSAAGRDEPRVAFFPRDFPDCAATAPVTDDLTAA